MLEYFRELGIRYVIWEYYGGGMYSDRKLKYLLSSRSSFYRRVAQYNIYFRNILASIIKSSEIIHDDKQIVVFDIFPEEN